MARHGKVVEQGLCYGRTDVALAQTAAACAEALLANVPTRPQALWSSPLRRCLDAALLLGERWGLAVQVEPLLQELDHGAWEGLLWKDLEANDGARVAAWMAAWTTAAPPGGESVEQLSARVARAWAKIPDGAFVLAHAGVIRALRVRAGTRWEDAMSVPVPHLTPEAFEAFQPEAPTAVVGCDESPR